MVRPGERVGRYVADHVIGAGATAMVYRVHDDAGEAFALKALHAVDRRGLAERLAAEGRIQAGIRHPNVLPVHEVLALDGRPALVMELVDGGTLQGLLARQRLTPGRAERLFLGILAGVAHAHARGIVHRDLKPANILLRREREGIVPVVADFGLAKRWQDDARQTQTGLPMGTPRYMAPEQIRDAKRVDARADIFALGCLLYEMLCGAPPFDGPDLPTLYRAVLAGRYQPPEALVPGLPPRLSRVIAGCLQVRPERRLPTCQAVHDALVGCAETLVPPMPRPVRPPRPRAPDAAAWVGALTSVTLGVAIALGIVALVA